MSLHCHAFLCRLSATVTLLVDAVHVFVPTDTRPSEYAADSASMATALAMLVRVAVST